MKLDLMAHRLHNYFHKNQTSLLGHIHSNQTDDDYNYFHNCYNYFHNCNLGNRSRDNKNCNQDNNYYRQMIVRDETRADC